LTFILLPLDIPQWERARLQKDVKNV
jgi:hypothetical protein